MWEFSVLSAPFFSQPKTAQKVESINLQKCISRSKGTGITQISLKITTRLAGCLEETKNIFKLLAFKRPGVDAGQTNG